MVVNSLPKTVTRQRRDCDLNPGPSAPESSTLTTRLPSHPRPIGWATKQKNQKRGKRQQKNNYPRNTFVFDEESSEATVCLASGGQTQFDGVRRRRVEMPFPAERPRCWPTKQSNWFDNIHASNPPLSFLQAGCAFLLPNQQRQSTEDKSTECSADNYSNKK